MNDAFCRVALVQSRRCQHYDVGGQSVMI